MYQTGKRSNAKNNKDQLEALPQAGPLRSLRPLSLSLDSLEKVCGAGALVTTLQHCAQSITIASWLYHKTTYRQF